MSEVRRLSFAVSESAGRVSGILLRPDDARALYVFGHGAGAGLEHDFMEAAARGRADHLARATLHVVEEADHGFHVLKRSGRTDIDVLEEILDNATRWMEERL